MISRSRLARRGAILALIAALAVASACGAVGGAAQPSPSSMVVVGPGLLDRPAPVFDLLDLAGQPVRLADYTGRPVIVNFWASWCIPCQQEFPMYRQVRLQYAAQGLEILGVVYQDSATRARAFMASHDAGWPALLDPGGKTARAYGVLGIPMSFFVDRHGVVRAVSYGPPPQTVLQQDLARIL